MKPLFVILAICSLGYAVDHWQDRATGIAGVDDN